MRRSHPSSALIRFAAILRRQDYLHWLVCVVFHGRTPSTEPKLRRLKCQLHPTIVCTVDAPSIVNGAMKPVACRAPRKVVVCQRPQGVFSLARVPTCDCASVCVMLILTQVSSIRLMRLGSMHSCEARHWVRLSTTSGRCCSLAISVFFSRLFVGSTSGADRHQAFVMTEFLAQLGLQFPKIPVRPDGEFCEQPVRRATPVDVCRRFSERVDRPHAASVGCGGSRILRSPIGPRWRVCPRPHHKRQAPCRENSHGIAARQSPP
ncbi:hypothetical protein Pla8534_47600 [Lignipirellula cremea]|uniref:Uncharacterized protein n=1 Tax=Lignipirellula cremea TaxID=2528010 RepID=A0A518DYM2_9BACT|nr:hypothetical protein Pla8534_47600 [Lignipirellula cremea]